MRLALGAGRMRVIRQLLIENIVLFTLGGVGGVMITVYVTRLLSTFQLPFDVPLVLDFSPDLRVLVFALGCSAHSFGAMLAAFLTGLALGSAVFARVVDRWRHPEKVFGIVEILIGIASLQIRRTTDHAAFHDILDFLRGESFVPYGHVVKQAVIEQPSKVSRTVVMQGAVPSRSETGE